jgi:hypothetical protein
MKGGACQLTAILFDEPLDNLVPKCPPFYAPGTFCLRLDRRQEDVELSTAVDLARHLDSTAVASHDGGDERNADGPEKAGADLASRRD